MRNRRLAVYPKCPLGNLPATHAFSTAPHPSRPACAPGYGQPGCASCAMGKYSAGGTASNPKQACSACPNGTTTTGYGRTAAANCTGGDDVSRRDAWARTRVHVCSCQLVQAVCAFVLRKPAGDTHPQTMANLSPQPACLDMAERTVRPAPSAFTALVAPRAPPALPAPPAAPPWATARPMPPTAVS